MIQRHPFTIHIYLTLSTYWENSSKTLSTYWANSSENQSIFMRYLSFSTDRGISLLRLTFTSLKYCQSKGLTCSYQHSYSLKSWGFSTDQQAMFYFRLDYLVRGLGRSDFSWLRGRDKHWSPFSLAVLIQFMSWRHFQLNFFLCQTSLFLSHYYILRMSFQ